MTTHLVRGWGWRALAVAVIWSSPSALFAQAPEPAFANSQFVGDTAQLQPAPPNPPNPPNPPSVGPAPRPQGAPRVEPAPAPPGPPPPLGQLINVRVDVTITDKRGTNPPITKILTLMSADREGGSIR